MRLALHMGYPPGHLVSRGEGVRAEMGQSRGAQSGEVDRQAVWTEARDLEPRWDPLIHTAFWMRFGAQSQPMRLITLTSRDGAWAHRESPVNGARMT